jgi:hypothetical protein
VNLLRWNLVERVGEDSAEDCKVLDCVFGYRRSSKIMLRMAEEEYECEKLDYGDKKENM